VKLQRIKSGGHTEDWEVNEGVKAKKGVDDTMVFGSP